MLDSRTKSRTCKQHPSSQHQKQSAEQETESRRQKRVEKAREGDEYLASHSCAFNMSELGAIQKVPSGYLQVQTTTR